MPTLQSIRVAPKLIEKFRDDIHPPIQTPLALLARDSTSTAGQLKVPISSWNEVRAHVADAILRQASTGKLRKRTASQQDDGYENGNFSTLMIGSISALDFWRNSQISSLCPLMIPGCPTLNTWFSHSHLTQITGSPSSGKTQLCLSLAISWVKQNMAISQEPKPQKVPLRTVLYITTSAPPTALARRLRQLAIGGASPGDDLSYGQTHHQQRQMLNHIEFMVLSTPHQLLATLQQLMEDYTIPCDGDSSEPSPKSLLVILDSISGCLGGCNDWNLISQIAVSLKHLVHFSHDSSTRRDGDGRNFELQLVMTNGTTSSGDAALGPTWSSRVPEAHIRLRLVEPQRVQATWNRSHTTVETMEFTISAEGIQEISQHLANSQDSDAQKD